MDLIPVLKFNRLSPKAYAPSKGSEHAAGFDLYSAYNHMLLKEDSVLIQTDISIVLPEGTYGKIAPRSGLAFKHKMNVHGGVIDRDYTGGIGIILFNHGNDFTIKKGDRIAKLIVEKIEYPILQNIIEEIKTERGAHGFGSSGL